MTGARMTRRDRAAMALALECARDAACRIDAETAMESACEALRNGGPMAYAIRSGVLWAQELWAIADRGREGFVGWRRLCLVLRARLALLLRALLRADAGDFGSRRLWCPACCSRRVATSRNGGPWACEVCGTPGVFTPRITPLWELAPASRRT